ncbi:MAG: hypothetical protein QXR39_08980 [Candidatus Methanomethylicia archaeon]
MIKELKISVEEDKRTGGNHYKFKDQNDKDVTPILSQGHYNSLALSIFISMVEILGEKMPFKFIIFDDPSQSLGDSEKEGFVTLLNKISSEKKLIVATMDLGLYNLMRNNIIRHKKIYLFESWQPQDGLVIKEE